MNLLNEFSFAADEILTTLQAEINNLDKKINELRPMQVSIENAFDSQAFVEWFDAVHESLSPDHCWDHGPMFEVLVGLYNSEENPKDAAEQSLKDFEEWQFNLEMEIPSWDR